jgi:hypothetical protein
MPKDKGSDAAELEHILPEEATQIANIVRSTQKQVERRYAKEPRFLRGVHPKAHGCLDATFTVLEDLAPEYRVGVFAQPGRQYRAEIRFSNAAPLVTPDTPLEDVPGSPGKQFRAHGSRGMAVKLHDVAGTRLMPDDPRTDDPRTDDLRTDDPHNRRTQDFLMINQPVFAFANVEDYEVLSRLIETDERKAAEFFARTRSDNPAVKARADETLRIISCIKSSSMSPQPPLPPEPRAFQAPPLSPLDNRYFSAAPFLFGEGRVMKYGARPVKPVTGDLGQAVEEENYLRAALKKRMAIAGGEEVVFEFQVQVRDGESLSKTIDKDIEDACTLWNDDESKPPFYPFVTVAKIVIPPQEVLQPLKDEGEYDERCERLEFSPWHGLVEHRPLGSINRLRRPVYEKSVELRRCPAAPPPKPPGSTKQPGAAAPGGAAGTGKV